MQLEGSGNLNWSRAYLLLALAVVSLPYACAAVQPLYVTVYVDKSIVDTVVVLNIRGRVTGPNQSAVALASVSIQVIDPYESSLHIALVYSDNSGEYSDTFQLPSGQPAGDYAIYVTATKPGFQDAYARLTFSVSTPPFRIGISSDWTALLAAAAVLAVILAVIYILGVRRKKPLSPQTATAEYLEGLTLSPSTLLSLPDHLRKTAIIVCQLGEASAVEVAARSGRARAAESDYLNQLARMGILKKKRKGRESFFSAE